MMQSKKLRMVGYGRVSTDEERQLDSLENQVLFFSQYAEAKNHKLIHVYADEGISGKQLKNREQFMRMLQDAELDLFDVVVVKDVSRFARNTVDLLTSVRKLKSLGINVVFVNNSQESIGESEFVLTLLGAMAQEESANLSKRVQFGKKITAQKGRVPMNVLGYDRIDNYTLKINEEEAAVVRRIYSMYLSGMYGLFRIALALRQENILTKKGYVFGEEAVRRVLTNPLYCGELVNHKSVTVDFINGIRKDLPEEERFRHDRPELAIISREEFDEAQRIRSERCKMQVENGKDPRRRYTSRYLLSGLVRCAECGRTMARHNADRGNGKFDNYWKCVVGTRPKDIKCNNHSYIRNDVLEKALTDILTQCVGDREAFAAVIQNQIEMNDTYGHSIDDQLEQIEKRVNHLLKQKQKYVEMCAAEAITIEDLKQYTTKLTEQIERLELEAAALRRDQRVENDAQKKIDSCLAEIERFVSLETMNNGDLKKILSAIKISKDREVSFIFKVM